MAACLAACPAAPKPVWRRWNAARPTQSLNAWNCAPVHPAMLQRFVAGSYLPPFCTAHRHGMLEQLRAKATELVPISDMLTAAMRMKPFQIMVAPLSLDVGIAFGVPGPPSGMGEAAGGVEVDKRMIIPHPRGQDVTSVTFWRDSVGRADGRIAPVFAAVR